MTTQTILSDFAKWLEQTVCSRLKFKVAMNIKRAEDAGYEYKLVNPAVYVSTFPLTAAAHDSVNDKRPVVAPCVIVSGSGEGSIDFATGFTETPIQLMLQVWNPGQHIEITNSNGIKEKAFEVDANGYKDVACFVECIIDELAKSELPGGLVVSKDAQFSLPNVEENTFYPYYRGTVEFSVTHYREIKPKFNI